MLDRYGVVVLAEDEDEVNLDYKTGPVKLKLEMNLCIRLWSMSRHNYLTRDKIMADVFAKH